MDVFSFMQEVNNVVSLATEIASHSEEKGKDRNYEMMKARMLFKSRMETIANGYLK